MWVFSWDKNQYYIVVSGCIADPLCLSVNLRSSFFVVATGPLRLIRGEGKLTSVSRLKLPLGSHKSLNPEGHSLDNFSDKELLASGARQRMERQQQWRQHTLQSLLHFLFGVGPFLAAQQRSTCSLSTNTRAFFHPLTYLLFLCVFTAARAQYEQMGRDVTMQCGKLDSNASVSWKVNGTDVMAQHRLEGPRLTLSKVDLHHNGRYSCFEEPAGEMRDYISLHVGCE